MEKNNPASASVPGTNSGAGSKHEAQLGVKQTTVPPVRFWILSVGVCLGLFLSIIDTSIVATSIYSIGVEFQDVRRVNWVALAYTLAYLGCAVTFARVSDVVGRRNAFVAAYILFFAFSLGCGFAQSLSQLIVCRTLQGIGGSGLYSLPMIILPELCPEHLRQHIGSVIGLVIAGSGALGPVLGGILTHYATWRWVFWINGPIGFVSLVIFFLSWPKSEHLPSMTRRSWKEFDFVGSILIIAAAVLVVFPFQNAGESPATAWGTAIFIVPLTVGLVLWLALLAWGYLAGRVFEGRLAPTFPIGLFRHRAYAAAAISTLFIGYPYFMLTYAFPLRAQVVGDKSPLLGGIMLLPMLGSTAVGSILSGFLSRTKNYLSETMLVGACLMTLGVGLLTTVHGAGDDAKALGFIVFTGLGFGLNVASATMLTSFEVPIIDYAPAQGIIAQLRILGGSLGISTSTVFLNTKASELSGLLTPQEQATLGQGGTPLSPEQRSAVHRAFSEAFHNDMVAAAAVSGAAVLVVLGTYRRRRMLVADQKKARVQEEIARRVEQHGSKCSGSD
ncbi:putative MFS-type transporter C1399,02 [Talaromyces islandicus]|uniref:Putative MFS-type transporter C1399,02 n=1 Tax=Talaromyces islandicus TaxID=28573 RepID=A0A0U1M710_TALIS|nr:putative MFS-type transporter C1399,02 [Talaromyces islandicus]